ncbi:hypothetical protein BOTBODRAFT_38015 [Botryobasidium botryosum FD-172 SS1]|uniref:Uncharacterized protein n=1 Tax=Botryobasidium botryosum (strain FD-172 SS1) TaxID=930990 RepID=A0A067LYM1_BOTB1|nr:hypothetical protein BOTBODRAFT_38015 [Botryobasidium botryosum FD-172 SS1]
MKASATLLPFFAILLGSVSAVPLRRDTVDPNLVPDLGFQSGVNPTGTGDCDGAVNGSDGKPIKVPCSCPPSRDAFIAALTANVEAGKVINNPTVGISFPSDNSVASQEARIEAAIVTLQSLNGPGQGCPVVSTTLGIQQQALQSTGHTVAPVSIAATSTPAAAPATTAVAKPAQPTATPATPAAPQSTALSAATIASLAPSLGFQSGVNPTGTGDCDGAVNGSDGKPIKVPCSCPPSQAVYLQALEANVDAGFVIKNPSVKVTFPTDSSKASQAARVEAAIVTLQSLNGPGQGCPVASTTLGAQQKALQS